MRVLHISPGKLFGGVETSLITLARFSQLCPEMKPEFAICFDGRLARELQQLAAQVHMLGEVRASSPLTVWRARRHLRNLLRAEHFDVVVCHMPWVQAIFGPVVRDGEVALAFFAHGPSNGRHWTERWAALTPPDLAICVSHFVRENLSKIYPAIAGEVVYHPVAPLKVPSLANRIAMCAEAQTSSDAVVIIQSCRLEPGKGQRALIEALGLIKEVPGWIFWQVGGPQSAVEREYFDSLRDRAAQLGITDRVHFWGQLIDVACVLAASDIYCQPNESFSEGLGLSFVEAMSTGLPVVTTRLGAVPEVVDETCGMLLAPGDVVAVASALKTLIGDRDLRRALGTAGRSRAEKMFAPAVQVQKLHDVLAKIALDRPDHEPPGAKVS